MSNTGYRFLPLIYDRWQQSYGKDFSALILPKLLQTIKAYSIPRSELLDIACGTGTLAIMMTRRGWDVLGMDISEGMIREAVEKSGSLHLPVTFSRRDMRSFSVPNRVGLITCIFDAINHLRNARDVLQCFRSVHRALRPGGYFVFDVNNELCYRTVWRQTDAINNPDFTIILHNSYNAQRREAKSQVTMFLRRGETFEKKTETVGERYYPPEDIEKFLRSSGFQVVESEDFNFSHDPLVGKIKTWWVAKANT